MKKSFAEFAASGKPAKKFIEEIESQGSLSISDEIPAGGLINQNSNVDIPLTDVPSDVMPSFDEMHEEADPLGSGNPPAPTSPEPAKDATLQEEGDPLGSGNPPAPTNPEPAKDVPLPE